jgi:hypothetical protein
MPCRFIQILAVFLLFVGLLPAARADDVTDAFTRLCAEWTQHLASRERHNLDEVNWEFSTTGVRGTYIGYTAVRSCGLQESQSPVRIGMMKYLEVRYEKHGWTVAEAEANPPTALETTQITEIFQHKEGKWQY